MNRWTIGLLLGFAVVLVANGVLVWAALGAQEADPVEASYQLEAR